MLFLFVNPFSDSRRFDSVSGITDSVGKTVFIDILCHIDGGFLYFRHRVAHGDSYSCGIDKLYVVHAVADGNNVGPVCVEIFKNPGSSRYFPVFFWDNIGSAHFISHIEKLYLREMLFYILHGVYCVGKEEGWKLLMIQGAEALSAFWHNLTLLVGSDRKKTVYTGGIPFSIFTGKEAVAAFCHKIEDSRLQIGIEVFFPDKLPLCLNKSAVGAYETVWDKAAFKFFRKRRTAKGASAGKYDRITAGFQIGECLKSALRNRPGAVAEDGIVIINKKKQVS